MSGRLIVVAPASITAVHSSTRKSGSLRPESSAENSMSYASSRPAGVLDSPRANATIAAAVSRHCARVMFSLCFRWISDDAMKVCTRCSGAWRTAS